MGAEVIDTNVLHLATAAEEGWVRPRVPTDDAQVHLKVFRWLSAFRDDPSRRLVMDGEHTIWAEYRHKLEAHHFGLRVVQHKWDTGAIEHVTLDYALNGSERVAVLPEEAREHLHDLGDRKIVAAAWLAVAPIVNATDGDWEEPEVVAGLRCLGVTVLQLLTPEERAACQEQP